jgi:hypothetical protein
MTPLPHQQVLCQQLTNLFRLIVLPTAIWALAFHLGEM